MRFLIGYLLLSLACWLILCYIVVLCKDRLEQNGWFSDADFVPDSFSEAFGYFTGLALCSIVPLVNVFAVVTFVVMLFVKKRRDAI